MDLKQHLTFLLHISIPKWYDYDDKLYKINFVLNL